MQVGKLSEAAPVTGRVWGDDNITCIRLRRGQDVTFTKKKKQDKALTFRSVSGIYLCIRC